ncbi:DEAD/DEAH box helicase [Mesorhizobium onobrychidis]|uniref:DEAD/DEAH box helicase n=1 Tax=Mesorhizobium onobrychidis TaxID=2775404 RepID=A0ABY5R8T0_9HYPH|nr:DEAD/DEAH box helicase [Mesorhizobium onobrychidis]UVC19387.1 DEAD/DEAH box helicase [Mesorhizobium onobrychidis]
MSKRLVEALSRAGVTSLYSVAGKAAVDLLERIESKTLSAHGLAQLVVDRYGASQALQEPEIRALIIPALKRNEADNLAGVLGLSQEDPFAALQRVDFSRSEDQLATLHAFFGVVYEPPGFVEEKPSSVRATGTYVLFPHQRRASLEVRHKLATPRARVLLHMPTGAGKTRTAMTTIADLLRAEPDERVIVWLAHSEELCDQAFDEAAKAWRAIGSRELTIYRHYGDSRVHNFAEVRDGFVIGSLALMYLDSLKRQDEFLDLSSRIRLIVMDEAHQAIAPTYSHLINLLQRNAATGVLGLSATPGRSLIDVGADLALANFFNRQKVTLNVEGYDNPIDYLVDEGYLARMEFVELPFDMRGEVKLSSTESQRLADGFDLPGRILDALASDDARNLLIVDAVAAEVAGGGKVILFAISVEHAALIASVLKLRGVSAAAVTSSTPTERRRQTIQRFKDTDELMVLCNYGVLTTGFDAPRTNVAVIARPTSSVVLYSQMIGRAARGTRAGGNEKCRILTVVDRVPGFRSLGEGFEFWNDIWEED